MIRWRFVLTRLAIVIAIVALLHFALSPLAAYLTVKAVESATGAKATMASTHVGFFPPSISYQGVTIADPRDGKSMVNAFTADSIELELDGDALLHRRYVVREACISGLQIGSERIESGHFDPQPTSDSKEDSVASQCLSQFFDVLTDSSRKQLENFGNELETVKRADQIRRRWKSEYAVLTKRAEDLEESIKQIGETAKGIENPLRDWARIEASLAKAKQIQTELAGVRASIDEIPNKVQADLISLQAAKQQDLDRIETLVSFDISGADNFGPKLLADVVNRQVDRMRQYIDNGRELASWTVIAPTSENRARGETIDLNQGCRQPTMLVRRCEVSGNLTAEGKPYALTGLLENLTSEPRLRDKPFHARLKLDGSQVVRLDYARDDSSTQVRETMTIHWPEVQAPALKIGDAQSLAMDIKDGKMELWAQLDTVGDQLQGRLVSRRVGTKIVLESNPNFAKTAIVSSLEQTLAAIDRVEIDAAFSGTWSDMDVAISTNLTQVLKTGIDQAVVAQVEATRTTLTAKLNDTYQAQMSDLQKFLTSEQTQARSLIAKADSTIQNFSDKILGESSATDAYLGRLRGGLLR